MTPSLTPPAVTRLDFSILNEPQREAALHGDGPLLILAGAGSGKTRVITYRIAYLLECGVAPWNILAVTFTNKAAQEMKHRVFELTQGKGAGVWVSTFHSFCAQFLRTEGSHYGLGRNFSIYDDDDQKRVLKECLQELHLDEKKLNLGQLASKISREKDQLMDAESYAIAASVSGDPNKEIFASIYALYDKKLKQAMALDFGDLIMRSVQLLHEHAELAAKMQQRFRYVMVDEYQDTNRAQYVLTKILAEKHHNICVVGDDDQSIYSWRGADLRNILEFEKDYPDVKVVKLEQNYRSTQPILDAAWKLVQNNRVRKEKRLWTERQSDVPVSAMMTHNELAEAEWIAMKVLEISEDKGIPLSHFAVFYRTNAQSRVIEDAFRRMEIPYILVGNVRFYERAEVKDVLGYLKAVVNPQDSLSVKRIVNFPARGIGKTSIEAVERFAAAQNLSLYDSLGREDLYPLLPKRAAESLFQFRKMLDEWIAQRDQMTVSELILKIFDRTRLIDLLKEEARNDLDAAARLDNVQELLNAAEEFEENAEQKSPGAYLERVALMTNLDTVDNKKNGVTLMTVHLAKGLEFPVVFVTGLEEGLFPLGESQFSQEELEEERRLAYVGMTRARDKLFLTAASSRKLFGQTHWNLPSRFIEEAGLELPGARPSFLPRESAPAYTPGAPSSSDDDSLPGSKRFKIGQRVRHAEFGPGRVTQKTGSGDDTKVTVEFDNGLWKKLMVKYAPLEKM